MDFSLIISTFKREYLLKKTIPHILSFKEVPAEIIIVDDNSNDGTYELAKQYGCRYVDLKREGRNTCCLPKNVGVKLAKCDYVMFTEPEMWWLTPMVTQLRESLEGQENIYINASCIYNDNPVLDRNLSPEQLLEKYPVWRHTPDHRNEVKNGIMNMMDWMALWIWGIRKEYFFRIGGYVEDMPGFYAFDDIDLTTRFRIMGIMQVQNTEMRAFHMWHPSHPADPTVNGRWFEAQRYDEPDGASPIANRGKEWGVVPPNGFIED